MTEPWNTGSLDLLSGPWTALWKQGPDQGTELLDLAFQEGQVLGLGSDRDGTFQYTGTFTPAGQVELGKVYTTRVRMVPARMTYIGQWNGQHILGRWADDCNDLNAGPFRMWPGQGPDPGEVLETAAEPGLEAELVAVQALPRQRAPHD